MSQLQYSETAGRETDCLPGIFTTDTLSTTLKYLYLEGCVGGWCCGVGGEEGEAGNKGMR